MAADEYRVEVNLDDEAHGHPFTERLSSLDLDDEVAARLGDRVIVTRDGPHLFVYTGSRQACAEAERVVRDTLIEDGLSGDVSSTRWDPAAGRWQDADQPAAEEGAGPDYAKEAAEEKVPHPLFVYIEGHQPHFLRDLGV
jgi:hypothetical protein